MTTETKPVVIPGHKGRSKKTIIEGRKVEGEIGCQFHSPCWTCPDELANRCPLGEMPDEDED